MSLPNSVKNLLKRNGSQKQIAAAEKIGRWCDKLGHKVVGGTAIGKYYDTLILDLTYNGCEIYIHENGFDKTDHGYPGVTINGVEIDGSSSSFMDFATEVEKIFPNKTACKKASCEVAADAMCKVASGLTAARMTKESYSANIPAIGARGFQIEAELMVELTRDTDTSQIRRIVAHLKSVNAGKYGKLDDFLFKVLDNDLDAREINGLEKLFNEFFHQFKTGSMYQDNGEIPFLPNQSVYENGDVHMMFTPKGFGGKELNMDLMVNIDMEGKIDKWGELDWDLEVSSDKACFGKSNGNSIEIKPDSEAAAYIFDMLEKETRFVAGRK